jgi:NSS family neurotransmitter:Na+ symporter
MMANSERFTSRWGLVLAAIGMAVGAGNIWRFPRMVAENGGSAFLIAWLIFLFLWSMPLLIAEFAIGKHTRLGTIGSFGRIMGNRFAWMGSFVGFCTMAIMFYYSVVTGWSLFYFLQSISGGLASSSNYSSFWGSFTTSYNPLLFHIVAISFAALVISRGVVKGIERVAKIFVPALFVLLVIAAIRALFLPNAAAGLNFLFYPNLDKLLDYRVWLQALSQSAWSTGAGWGLILTYAVYMKQKEDVNMNAFLTGLGNNSASLIVALAIIPTVFSLLSESAAHEAMNAGNQGLTFIWMPRLFDQMPLGSTFSTVFFLTLFIAALSSLIPMVELATRIFVDFGMERKKALSFVWLGTLLLGVPSALSLPVLDNQDWTWGFGLIVSGLFFALAVRRFGAEKFRLNLVNTAPHDLHVGKWYTFILKYVIPIEFAVLILWWSYESVNVFDTESWWNPLRPFSLGTWIFQVGVVLVLFKLFNNKIVSKIKVQA